MRLLLYAREPHDAHQSQKLRVVAALHSQLNIEDDPYVKRLKSSRQGHTEQLRKALTSRKTYCQEQIKSLASMAANVQAELGSWAADYYLSLCVQKLTIRRTEGPVDIEDGLEIEEKRYLKAALQGIHDSPTVSTTVPANYELTSKVHRLLECLVEVLEPGFAGLIFVKTRASVYLLAHLLSVYPTLAGRISVGTFVGTSNNSKRKSKLGEVASSDQTETLDDLRSGKKNLIITTSILEEGIDVSACNVVICFEAPPNLKSFIQRRGRARKSRSKYIIMLEEGSMAALTTWEDLEQQMKQMYMDEMRELKHIEEEEAEEEESKTFHVKTTGARITSHEAPQHLHHFCSTLPATQYADLRPIFNFEGDRHMEGIYGTVSLPACVDSSVREFRSKTGWRTEKAARRDVAFEAYVALYEAGLVNDNLLPLKGYDAAAAEAYAEVAKRPAMVSVHSQLNPFTMVSWQLDAKIWKYRININSSMTSVVPMIMLSPCSLPPIPQFTMYLDSDVILEVKIAHLETVPYDAQYIIAAKSITKLILSAIYGYRMDESKSDFLFLFIPALEGTAALQLWLLEMTGTLSANDIGHHQPGCHEVGLVRDTSQNGLRYVFHGTEYRKASSIEPSDGMVLDQCSDSNDVLHLEVSKLPKRADFLHPISTDSQRDHTKPPRSYLVAENCEIDRLSFSYSQFALFIPSIIHHLELAFVTDRLCKTILEPVSFHRRDLVTTAISASAAREASNWQRIELMGDTTLKLLTSLNLMADHLNWHEGYLSSKKDHIVSNGRLAVAAQTTGLDEFILTKPFTGHKWHPLYVSGPPMEAVPESRDLSTKSLADVVEALIGAAFLDGGLSKALACLSNFLPEINWQSLDECHKRLTEATSPNTCVTFPAEFTRLETLISHTFTTRSLLFSALTHPSHFATGANSSPSYDRLEYLGDAVLDFIVTTRIFHRTPSLPTGTMHLIRTALVNANFLAFFCLDHSVSISRNEVVEDSTGTFSSIETTSPLAIWQFMRHSRSAELAAAQQRCVARFKTLRPLILEAFAQGTSYPWTLLVKLDADKFFSDLVESIIGAIYVDTSGSLEACEGFLRNVGILEYLERVLKEGLHMTHPKEELGVIAGNDKIKYEVWVVEADDEGGRGGVEERGYACRLWVGEREACVLGGGRTRIEIETLAAEEAIRVLKAPTVVNGTGLIGQDMEGVECGSGRTLEDNGHGDKDYKRH